MTDRARLLHAAAEVRNMAHAPYSKFKVGAALLGGSGKIHTGCNVESSSFGLTICAERAAVVKAVSEGESEFEAIAVLTEGGATPCGACRQFLWDIAGDIKVFSADAEGNVREHMLSELLKSPFGDSNLRGEGR